MLISRLSKNATRHDIKQQMSRHWLRQYTTYDNFELYCISQSFRWFPAFFWKSPFLCPKRRTFWWFWVHLMSLFVLFAVCFFCILMSWHMLRHWTVYTSDIDKIFHYQILLGKFTSMVWVSLSDSKSRTIWSPSSGSLTKSNICPAEMSTMGFY